MDEQHNDLTQWIDDIQHLVTKGDYEQSMMMVRQFGIEQEPIDELFDAFSKIEYSSASLIRSLFSSYWSSLEIVPDHLNATTFKFLGVNATERSQENLLRMAYWKFISFHRRSWIAPMVANAHIDPVILHDMRENQLGHFLVQYIFSYDWVSEEHPFNDPLELLSVLCDEKHAPFWTRGGHPLSVLAKEFIEYPHTDYKYQHLSKTYNIHPYIEQQLTDKTNLHLLDINSCNIHHIIQWCDTLNIPMDGETCRQLLKTMIGGREIYFNEQDKQRGAQAFELMKQFTNQLWEGEQFDFMEHTIEMIDTLHRELSFLDLFLSLLPDHYIAQLAVINTDPTRWPNCHKMIAQHHRVVRHHLERQVDAGDFGDRVRRM